MGTWAKAEDESELLKKTVDAVNSILTADMKIIKSSMADYVRTEDHDAFMLALLPTHYRVLYEAYAPYWLAHCHPVDDRDDDAEFTYYNDLIDMYWAWKWQEWKKKGEWCVTLRLPPTAGLIRYQYQKEKDALADYLGQAEARPDPSTVEGSG